MLGKDQMARLRSLAKRHNLAAGSQTIPNSIAEAAVARGELPSMGSPSLVAPPAPVRKKLPPKRAERKIPTVVSNDGEDESTEDGLVCKRNRATTTEPPTIESAGPDYAENPPNASTPFESAGDTLPSNTSVAGGIPNQAVDVQSSPQPVVEPNVSPPHPDASLVVHSYEGGGENQPSTPLPISALPAPVEEVLKAHAAYLSAMTTECVEKRLYKMMGEALKDSLNQYESEAGDAKDQVQQLKRDLTMQGLEFSRLENALKDKLRNKRKNGAELHKKLNDKLLEVAELESRLVPQQEQIAVMEEALEAKKAYVNELESKSIEREDLLGKIEAEKDQKAKELSEKDKELNESATKLAQALEENEKLKKQIEELDLSAANVLTSGFGAALEQFPCAYPDLDLSQFSICHEVVDGKIVPSD
ncbi:uncharacterized protein [Phaseolus vulgaris]|uniref:uncharacterized protein n=1 Tax=Phaseolus vulgaris TaxID=3885 RepID=UPI0035CA90DF